MNKVELVGRIGRDPELSYIPSGKAKVKFSLATSRRWKNEAGEKQEKTAWHNIVVWGPSAQNCAKYLGKGDLVAVVGEIEYREWDKDGQRHYMTEIVASEVDFLITNRERGERGSSGGAGPSLDHTHTRDQSPATAGGTTDPQWDGDVPF